MQFYSSTLHSPPVKELLVHVTGQYVDTVYTYMIYVDTVYTYMIYVDTVYTYMIYVDTVYTYIIYVDTVYTYGTRLKNVLKTVRSVCVAR